MEARGNKRAKRAPPVRTSREEIQQKAMELFLEKGYHGASTTDVCESLGISRPTLYWYFRDKEDLMFSIHKDRIENALRPMMEKVKSQKDPLQRLIAFIEEYTRLICSDRGAKVQIKEMEYMTPEHQEWVKEIWREQLQIVRDSIAQLQGSGKAKELSTTLTAFGLLGMITWAYTWFDFSRPEGVEGLVETIKEIFLSGVLKPGTPWRQELQI